MVRCALAYQANNVRQTGHSVPSSKADLVGAPDFDFNSTFSTLIHSIPEDLKVFCMQEFLPEMRVAAEGVQWSPQERIKFETDTIGTVLKLLYAFLWQVFRFDSKDFFFL